MDTIVIVVVIVFAVNWPLVVVVRFAKVNIASMKGPYQYSLKCLCVCINLKY